MQAAEKGVRNVFYGLLGQIVTICLGIVIPRLVLLSFGSEINGLINSANQIFTYFALFEAGVGVASLQALYAPVANKDKDAVQRILVATHLFYRRTGFIYGAAVIILAFIYPLFVDTDIPYWIIVGIILFGGLGNCFNFLYQGKYKVLMQAEGYLYVSTNITTVFNILVNLAKTVLLLAGCHVLVVQFSYFVVNIIQMLIYFFYVKKHYSWVDLKVEPDNNAISQKGATLIHQISWMVLNNTDVFLLTLITQNLKIVSIYTMYNLIITLIVTMIQQISSGFDFRLGQMYNTNMKQYLVLHHIFEIAYLVLTFSAMTLVYIFILPFMRLYTAGVNDINYIDSWYPLFFAAIPLLTCGRLSVSNLINYAGHFKKTQWRAILESAINLVTSIFGIWYFGIFGALAGTIVASLYRSNDMILYAYKYLIEGKPWKTYKRWLICFGIFGCVAAFVDQDNAMFASYPKILLYGCLYGLVIFAVYAFAQILINPKEWKELILIIKNYINSKKEQ